MANGDFPGVASAQLVLGRWITGVVTLLIVSGIGGVVHIEVTNADKLGGLDERVRSLSRATDKVSEMSNDIADIKARVENLGEGQKRVEQALTASQIQLDRRIGAIVDVQEQLKIENADLERTLKDREASNAESRQRPYTAPYGH